MLTSSEMSEMEAEFLRRKKAHLWEQIELLTALARQNTEGQNVELYGVWADRLEEIANTQFVHWKLCTVIITKMTV